MTGGSDHHANALAAAALLERWAEAVPVWDPDAGEPWDAFTERRYRAELALERRLRQLPGCELTLDAAGAHVDLTLAGIHVPRRNCLANACRGWRPRSDGAWRTQTAPEATWGRAWRRG